MNTTKTTYVIRVEKRWRILSQDRDPRPAPHASGWLDYRNDAGERRMVRPGRWVVVEPSVTSDK